MCLTQADIDFSQCLDCPKHQRRSTIKTKKTCLEWYKLEDGETRSQAVNTSRSKTFKDIEKGRDIVINHPSDIEMFKCHIYSHVSDLKRRGGKVCTSLLLFSHQDKKR